MTKQDSLTEALQELQSQPAIIDSPYLWDIEANICMQGAITRLASRNHKIHYVLSDHGRLAKVQFSEEEDRRRVPNKDFVLLIRDSLLNMPSGFTATSEEGEQAVSVNILTDITPAAERFKQLQSASAFDGAIDSDQNLTYASTETQESTRTEEEEEKKQDSLRFSDFVFLIDRSGSMNGAPIALAVRALKVFLHSLPIGCTFNVVSFGSQFEFLSPKPIEYNDETLEQVSAIVTHFKADMGGTELYQPLKEIFSTTPKQERVRQVFLLTDGAVSNTKDVLKIIKGACQGKDQSGGGLTKVHTFGLGSGVSTDLVRGSAIAGRGHYYFINDMQEIEKKVLDALQRESYEYLIVNHIRLLSAGGDLIKELEDTYSVAHGMCFRYLSIFDAASSKVASVEVAMHDPNTKQDQVHIVPLERLE